MNNRIIILAGCALMSVATVAQSVTVDGSRSVFVTAAANTGLASVIVVENAQGAELRYTPAEQSQSVTWQRYSSLGGGYAEEISADASAAGYSAITLGAEDMGYIITDGSRQTCVWVVNYASCSYNVQGIEVESSDCDRVYLHVTNPAGAIPFYTVNGRREELDRGIELEYSTMTYSESDGIYVETPVVESLSSLHETVSARVPLCDTRFTLNPDRFATAWGLGEVHTTSNFNTQAVEARTDAVQTPRDADNEQPVEAELGGSAPCEVTFSAAVTDAALYRRWEMSVMPDFDDVMYSYDSLDFTYTFTESGTTYVRFVANNAAGSCEFIGDTYMINIGESRLECPNAFSPGTTEGVNDEWKVSYRSIISFDCHIFNRWGTELAHLTDPSQGWDGRYGGKVVGSGVYYYVIKAIGSDGKEYKLSGDINVIGSRRASGGAVIE